MRAFAPESLIRASLLAVVLALPPMPGWAQSNPPPRPTPVVRAQGSAQAQKPTKLEPEPLPLPPLPPSVVPAASAPAESPPAKAAEPVKPGEEPPVLPRFQSLRSNEVNLRSGPGTRYRIDWVYKRADLPVEVQRHFEHWRLIRDAEGVQGWVNQATLTSRRTFVVQGGDARLLSEAKDSASLVAILNPGVIGRIRSCARDADWCQVQIAGHRGFLRRTQFWGTYPKEEVTP